MTRLITRAFGGFALVAVLVIGSAAPALAAKHHHRSHSPNGARSSETALTGTTLSSASSAALTAVPGGTVTSATTEADSSTTGAAYEVHITKTDGSKVLVIEDSSFTVLSTTADSGCGHGSASRNHGRRR
jgi:hypothetical protein